MTAPERTTADRTRDILKKVRVILADPKAWTKGALARDANGAPCSPNSRNAVCWCIEGAVEKATRRELAPGSPGVRALYKMLRAVGAVPVGISTWNDDETRTHAEVLALLDDMTREPETRKEPTS